MTHVHIHVSLCLPSSSTCPSVPLPICPLNYMSIAYTSYMCGYICMFAHTCTHTYLYIHVYVHAYIHPFIYPSVYSFIHTSTLSFLNPSVHSYIHYLPIHHLFIPPCKDPNGPSRFLPVAVVAGGMWHFGELRQEVHCAAPSPLQVCEPSLSGNITAFALKARVVYPINQKFRVSTPSSILSVKFTPQCAGLHGDPRAWIRYGFPSCLEVCCVTDQNMRANRLCVSHRGATLRSGVTEAA